MEITKERTGSSDEGGPLPLRKKGAHSPISWKITLQVSLANEERPEEHDDADIPFKLIRAQMLSLENGLFSLVIGLREATKLFKRCSRSSQNADKELSRLEIRAKWKSGMVVRGKREAGIRSFCKNKTIQSIYKSIKIKGLHYVPRTIPTNDVFVFYISYTASLLPKAGSGMREPFSALTQTTPFLFAVTSLQVVV